jgi:hypothetical protein
MVPASSVTLTAESMVCSANRIVLASSGFSSWLSSAMDTLPIAMAIFSAVIGPVSSKSALRWRCAALTFSRSPSIPSR